MMTIFVFDDQTNIPKSELFPNQVPLELTRTVFPTRDQQVHVCINFVSRGTKGSSMFEKAFGHLCRGRRIHMSGHSDSEILTNFGGSSIFDLGIS